MGVAERVRILVVNAGSSTLKLSVLGESEAPLAARTLDLPDGKVRADDVGAALGGLPGADAVGHRVVHGGSATEPAIIDDAVREHIASLCSLAPLHQARALAGIDAVGRARPGLAAIACYDTAFHAHLPAAAATYALPRDWRERYGLRRFGFHGLSHAWVARQVEPRTRLVSCHLGAGASLAAIRDGRSVDTTMGFTPLEGLVMATRSGSVDPGMLTWLLREGDLSLAALDHGLEHDSGLTGLAGTGDMRELLARDDADAQLALDVYVHRLRAAIAAMTASLGGLDVLAFTGGVGEHATRIRNDVIAGLAFLGPFETTVVTSREDLEIARQVCATLAGNVSHTTSMAQTT
jgi:acetate kinase